MVKQTLTGHSRFPHTFPKRQEHPDLGVLLRGTNYSKKQEGVNGSTSVALYILWGAAWIPRLPPFQLTAYHRVPHWAGPQPHRTPLPGLLPAPGRAWPMTSQGKDTQPHCLHWGNLESPSQMQSSHESQFPSQDRSASSSAHRPVRFLTGISPGITLRTIPFGIQLSVGVCFQGTQSKHRDRQEQNELISKTRSKAGRLETDRHSSRWGWG